MRGRSRFAALAGSAALLSMVVGATGPGRVAAAQRSPAAPARLTLDQRLSGVSQRNIAALAARNRRSAAQLQRLRNDATLHVGSNDRLMYVDAEPATVAPATPPQPTFEAEPRAFPFEPFVGTGSEALLLHSRPGASKTIFIDMNGATISGVEWNTYTGIASQYLPPYDLDQNPGSFNATEALWIADVWEAVAEDFAPFDIDVTTQQPSADRLDQSSPADSVYGTTVVVSPVRFACGSCAGIAWVGGIGDPNLQPALAFPTLSYYKDYPHQLASTISHEAGHTFDLDHDGTTAAAGGLEYYGGHGSFAPIMGGGAVWTRPQHQWSKGEYANANNPEDDIAKIAAHAAIVTDDAGDTAGNAVTLQGLPAAVTRGVISTDADVDRFHHITPGCVTVKATPVRRSPNVDLRLGIGPATGAESAANDPNGASAPSLTVLASTPIGINVTGEPYLGPINGYSGYGSLGYYSLSIDPSTSCSPASVSTGALGDRSVQLSWAAPPVTSIGAIAYTVALCPTTGEVCAGVTTTATAATVTGLLPGRTYSVSVATGSGASTSPRAGSSFVSVSSPAAPEISAVGSGGTLSVSWTAPPSYGNAITGYEVRVTDSLAATTQIDTVTSTSFTLATAPIAGSVAVRAINALGAGPWSVEDVFGKGTPPVATGVAVHDRTGAAPASTARATIPRRQTSTEVVERPGSVRE